MTHTIEKLIEPRSIDDFAFSTTRDCQLLKCILDGKLPFPLGGKNGICFWGGYGTGKTTLAKLMPVLLEAAGALQPVRQNAPFDARYKKYEFNRCGTGAKGAITLIGIESRCNDVHCQPTDSGWNYEILDEADLMQQPTQAAMKSIMTSATSTVFLLTTNHIDKIDNGIKDRCHLIEMNAPTSAQIVELSCRVLRQLGLTEVEIQRTNLASIAASCRGSWRELIPVLVLEHALQVSARTP
jgi:DNA polymerase III delta prime subunit